MRVGAFSKPASWLSRRIRDVRRATHDQAFRLELFARFGLIRGSFQHAGSTSEDRYPDIFEYVQSALGRDFAGRILSFGCATGEEAFTLERAEFVVLDCHFSIHSHNPPAITFPFVRIPRSVQRSCVT